MKKIITYIALLAAFTAVSCSRTETDFGSVKSGVLSLQLSTGDLETRSAIPDVEGVVSQFDWFFYPDATGTSAPVYHGHFTVGEDGTLTPSGTNEPDASEIDDAGTIHLGFDIEHNYSELKGSYYVYVLANYDGIDHNASDLKLNTLLAKTMETNFDELSSDYSEIADFVMDSYSGNDDDAFPQLVPLTAATDTDKDGKANLAVGLRRVAAKITFTINISEKLNDPTNNDTYWRPLTKSSDFTSYMVNAVGYAEVKGEPQDAEEMAPTLITGNTVITGGHQISYNTTHVKTATDEHDPNLVWELDPFYTYPVEFETDSNNAPYLKITLPWENVDAAGNLTEKGATVYYYKTYILDAETHEPLTSFERNKHYIVTLNVDTLGGTQEDYVTLDTYYYVADWQSPADGTYTGYFAPRFLDIAREVYYIYGDNSTTIAVTSSHNISARITSVNQKDINGDDIKTSVPSSASVATEGKVSFTLAYNLNTTLSSGEMDITPITWTVRVYHTDRSSYYKDVTIIQYPSIYAELNTTDSANSRFVNAVSSDIAYNNNDYILGKVSNQSMSTNKTVLTLSTLASLTDTYSWIIGDPRVKLSSKLPLTINSETWNQNDLGQASDYINNYLIADPSKANYIAPRFMLASGLGANTNKGTWKSNAERCAAYQEDGYPAGRWRLPTEAEIQFCRLMQTYGYISNVFQTNNSYWSSTGRYINTSGTFAQGDQSSSCSVRCVYDLWYWGETQYDNSGHPTTTAPATQWLGFMTE